jgi:ketosteroid isomerase-like protein
LKAVGAAGCNLEDTDHATGRLQRPARVTCLRPEQRGEIRRADGGHRVATTDAQLWAIHRADASFFEALVERDIPTLEALLAEDFMIVDVTSGSVHTRAAFLEAISGRMVTFQEIKTFPDETLVRLAGPGTGIAIGRTAMSFSDAQGALTEVASRYSHVFRADGESWQLISAQGTPIPSTSPSR